MSEPFVYVGTWTIKPGRVEEARRWLAEHADLIEVNEPRLVAFHVYFDEEGSTASVVQVHPDSASMEFHMKVIADHVSGAFDYIDRIVSEQYFGPMSESLAELLAAYDQPGVSVTRMPVHEAGFTRTNATR